MFKSFGNIFSFLPTQLFLSRNTSYRLVSNLNLWFSFKQLAIVIIIATIHNTLFSQEKLYTNTFELGQVKLLDGPFKKACELNIHVLLEYDADRFLAPFLREAGLSPKKQSYGNWERDGLDGHVGGHYLTALAINYAATGNAECKSRLDYMVSELKRCQQNNVDGYIGGVPNSKALWSQIKTGNTAIIWKYWVPWYNLHKTFAGLRDAWIYAGNEDAKQMFQKLSDWGISVISTLDDSQMEAMLANEFGGMNEVYADAYAVFGDEKYLHAAKRFSHRQIFDSMSKKIDNLDNKHANTQVPKAVGYQRIAELTSDSSYITAATFFWNTVVANRTLSLGGNSRREHFPEAHDCTSYMDEREGPETCNTNNMLKLTEGLFRMSSEAKYADYYERALYNHILSSQHPEHGGYVYFTPARPAHYRVYSSPNSAMWCCVGTGMENHGKYGEFIYTHKNDSLFVNLFIASELNWQAKNVVIEQKTNFPYEEKSQLVVKVPAPTRFKMMVRYPSWVKAHTMKVLCNGTEYAQYASPSSYVEIDRVWNNGDKVEISTPMHITVEEMPNMPTAISILKGPILLAARTSTENIPGLVANDGRWSHIASGPLVSVFDTPFILGERNEILSALNKMIAVKDKPFAFYLPENLTQTAFKNIVLEPFYSIHDSRYMMYWMSMTRNDYNKYLMDKKNEDDARILLDKRTVDVVACGEQQPEVDHQMKANNSSKGVYKGEPWRDAKKDGYFQYTMNTSGVRNLTLMVRYWGNESDNRAFNILLDDAVIAAENIKGKQNSNSFFDVEYKIPAKLLRAKKTVNIHFRPQTNSDGVSRIYHIRLLKSAKSVSETKE